MGLSHIPVIAISFKDLGEVNPGFSITPAMLYQAVSALQYGDLLMMLSLIHILASVSAISSGVICMMLSF